MREWLQLSLDGRDSSPPEGVLRPSVPPGYFALHSRRYLGCKTRLLPRIAEVVAAECPGIKSVFDVFAGTGVVADLFNSPALRVIVNDFLVSNYMILSAWFGAREEDREEIEKTMPELAGEGGDDFGGGMDF